MARYPRASPVVLGIALIVASCTSGTDRTTASSPRDLPRTDGRSRTARNCSVPGPVIGELLRAIAAASPSDVWAVGDETLSAADFPRTLVLRWGGHEWSRVEAPNVGPLLDVVAVGPRDLWATAGREFLHWDGASWSRYPLDVSEPGGLHALSADREGDVWAAGTQAYPVRQGYTGQRAWVIRWDGHSWVPVDVPDPNPGHSEMTDILVRSGTDVWAAGGYETPSPDPAHVPDPRHPFLLHWDGSAWTQANPPWLVVNSGIVGLGLDGANGAWLIGRNADGSEQPFYFARLVGTEWKRVPSPMTEGDEIATSIAGSGPDDVWAVGAGEYASGAVIEHWDGSSWRRYASIIKDTGFGGSPGDVVTLSPKDAWAVGYRAVTEHIMEAVIQHWDGRDWELVAPPPSRASPLPPLDC